MCLSDDLALISCLLDIVKYEYSTRPQNSRPPMDDHAGAVHQFVYGGC
ncbi:MAG: hypothetical protein RJB41_1424 [Actinomycetota bacterium]|jgi:hypothetical protein